MSSHLEYFVAANTPTEHSYLAACNTFELFSVYFSIYSCVLWISDIILEIANLKQNIYFILFTMMAYCISIYTIYDKRKTCNELFIKVKVERASRVVLIELYPLPVIPEEGQAYNMLR